MTNAPLMLNVYCDMYANNPQVFLHAMCMVFGFKKEENCAFFQFPQAFYDGLKDDPFGNQLANLYYIANGISSIQGTVYAGSNCFHRRKVIYDNMSNEDLHKMFGKSVELRESVAQILSEANSKIENQRSPSNFIEAAIHVASCSYEYDTLWGKQVGWLYGSATEDILTGLSIHGRGWRSVMTSLDPRAFLGFRSVYELCYASLPAYCIITGSHFLPKINERPFPIFMGIFVIYNLYVLWECKRIGVSLLMWWNLQRMGRVNVMTAWSFAFLSVILKLMGLSDVIFKVTKKEHRPSNGDNANDNDIESVGLFGSGRYGIPFSTIWKSGALALLFVQLCRRSSQFF
ncbi:hypothetical protein L1987_84785 [Smallanthus sonchifolius]|uniref:Uncharacterized protein n=1 Tax=Smallanthus sonchifolius TaxID=185202 RepID=A0ACB8XWB8_9ASTR|nr:hypothetical protein L1987_84785 [Smallanthus sonchifolius]